MAISSKLEWYWHRLRAMSAREMALHLRKKFRARADARQIPDFGTVDLSVAGLFPRLPLREAAPAAVNAALQRDVDRILNGKWKAFGHLEINVDNPPHWHTDYLIGRDYKSRKSSFKLDHREQEGGGDIKMIWEPSRWYQVVRLAQGAYFLGHQVAAERCLEWIESWVKENPPYQGLNWTSALETGMRLMQFTWIDALLASSGVPQERLERLRRAVLPPHFWYTLRYLSSGSSANNHLLGEIAGLTLALARWPSLNELGIELEELNTMFEREVLLQFAADGGNMEQALGYHLFSWEFCWQTAKALEASGNPISGEARTRLERAGHFYAKLKARNDSWDFGDSDNAYVTPFFLEEEHCAEEWREWFLGGTSPGIELWWGRFRQPAMPRSGEWELFPSSGYATFHNAQVGARFDFSPLGFLAIAAHGHLDALHLSLSWKGTPVVIDPGTGAYYADKTARNHLASWQAHNGPHLFEGKFPERKGGFMWGSHHHVPRLVNCSRDAITAELELPQTFFSRTIEARANEITVEDRADFKGASEAWKVKWQFAPGMKIEAISPKNFKVTGAGVMLNILLEGWSAAAAFNPPVPEAKGHYLMDLQGNDPAFLCSPLFRKLEVAPYLLLSAPGGVRQTCRTQFLFSS
ncbi:MAG: heparinase II/III family protein [Verrucomicrobiota bacterium]|nr:heparinase II/III family protein [Verrucomicrobiota bacterium]